MLFTEPALQEVCPDVRLLVELVDILKGTKNLDGVGRSEYTGRLFEGLGLDRASKQSVARTIDWLATAQTALVDLSQFLGEEIDKLRYLTTPPFSPTQCASIQDLPDEPLLMIMEEAVSASWPPVWGEYYQSEALRLSHVCSRFRTLALASSSLWTYRTSLNGANETLMQLERSKEQELYIHICDEQLEFESSPLAFLDAVAEHHSRWRVFELDINGDYRDDADSFQSFLSSISALCECCTLPSLRKLTLRSVGLWDEYDDLWAEFDEESEKILHFYTDWTCPKLENVSIENFIPYKFPMSETPLRELELVYDDVEYSGEFFDSGIVLDILRRQPFLQRLKIRISMPVPVIPAYSTIVRLDKLSTLEVSFDGYDQEQQAVKLLQLLQCLSHPVVSQLDINIHICQWSELSIVNYVDSRPGAFDSLNTINLKIHPNLMDFQLRKLLCLPHLSHLSIKVEDDKSHSRQALWKLYGECCYALRSLQIEGGEIFDRAAVPWLLSRLQTEGRLDDFQRLEVIRSPCFRRRDVEQFLPESKIVWID